MQLAVLRTDSSSASAVVNGINGVTLFLMQSRISPIEGDTRWLCHDRVKELKKKKEKKKKNGRRR
jgi:hypothetical protein